MKKNTVIIITVISILLFAGLVYYGLRHSRGVPVPVEKRERPVVEVAFLDKNIDLSKGISLGIWDALPGEEIELMYQVTVLPWGKSLVSPLEVKSFHNRNDIYFYFRWKDDTADYREAENIFTDASAIMLPMDEKVEPSTIMMGFMGKANIWQWKASRDEQFWQNKSGQDRVYVDFLYPFEEQEVLAVSKEKVKSAVSDLNAIRVATITPKDLQNVSGRGFWKDGTWQVVFKRSLKAVDPEIDAEFKYGEKQKLCAFAVWNGSGGDRGGRKSISDWVELRVK